MGFFNKTAASSRESFSLDKLMAKREKTAANIRLFEASGIFPPEDIKELEESLSDYDRRIAARQLSIRSEAQQEMQKCAAELKLAV